MKVSVCMATYNGSVFIKQQLDSILSQLSADDEVIISDDQSTDDTVDLIQRYEDDRLKVFRNEGRRGVVGNFENSLKRASGEVVFLADQDDVWLPSKVSETLRLLNTYDLVLSDCRVVDGKGNVLHPSFFAQRGSRPGFWRNLYKNSYVGCCMAFRRDLLNLALPFPSQIHMHDWWIGLLAERRRTVYFYRQPLILYVRHGDNASPTGEGGYGWGKRLRNRFLLLTGLTNRLMS